MCRVWWHRPHHSRWLGWASALCLSLVICSIFPPSEEILDIRLKGTLGAVSHVLEGSPSFKLKSNWAMRETCGSRNGRFRKMHFWIASGHSVASIFKDTLEGQENRCGGCYSDPISWGLSWDRRWAWRLRDEQKRNIGAKGWANIQKIPGTNYVWSLYSIEDSVSVFKSMQLFFLGRGWLR